MREGDSLQQVAVFSFMRRNRPRHSATMCVWADVTVVSQGRKRMAGCRFSDSARVVEAAGEGDVVLRDEKGADKNAPSSSANKIRWECKKGMTGW